LPELFFLIFSTSASFELLVRVFCSLGAYHACMVYGCCYLIVGGAETPFPLMKACGEHRCLALGYFLLSVFFSVSFLEKKEKKVSGEI